MGNMAKRRILSKAVHQWFRVHVRGGNGRQVIWGGVGAGKTTAGALWLAEQVKKNPHFGFAIFGGSKTVQAFVVAARGKWDRAAGVVRVGRSVVHINPDWDLVDVAWFDNPLGNNTLGRWRRLRCSECVVTALPNPQLREIAEKSEAIGSLATDAYPTDIERRAIAEMNNSRHDVWDFRRRFKGEWVKPSFLEKVSKWIRRMWSAQQTKD